MDNQPRNIRQTSIDLSNHERHAEERDYHIQPTILEVKLKFTKRNDRYTVDYEVLKDLNILRIAEILIAVDDGRAQGCKVLTVYPGNYEDGYGGNNMRFSNAAPSYNGQDGMNNGDGGSDAYDPITHINSAVGDDALDLCDRAFRTAIGYGNKDEIRFMDEQNEYNYNRKLKDTKHDGERMS
ncbi:hypothetical protein THOM_0125 [Trachipleistophora hominis]|uniref:Uncharacterized protein n=1 Tax=Trachipleistophora hominis TaxID=72359 RepID=L7JZL9_TRAHO|nr:hypothetical protein THOM_0125 [Trachipleistophora hominis]